MEQLITRIEDGPYLRFLVWDQEWTEAAVEELRRDHGVFFSAEGVVPVMVRGRILVLGIEDDGVLTFGADAPRFHVNWAGGLAAELADRRKGRRMIADNRYSSTLSTRKFEATRSQYVIYEHFRKLHKKAAKRSAVPAGRLTVFRSERGASSPDGESEQR